MPPILASFGASSIRSYGLIRALGGGGPSILSTIQVFQGTSSWTVPPGTTSVDYLIVGGGGGAGAGGGGAGGGGLTGGDGCSTGLSAGT